MRIDLDYNINNMETSINNKCKAFTSLEQSKKLAEILPLESADMCWEYQKDRWVGEPDYKEFPQLEYATDKRDIPCWSLASLLNVISGGQVNRMANSDKWEASSWNDSDFEPVYYAEGYDNPVDACYELILKLNELKML